VVLRESQRARDNNQCSAAERQSPKVSAPAGDGAKVLGAVKAEPILVDYTLFYHYRDLDKTPVRHVSYRATLTNGETRTGILDDAGRAVLKGIPRGMPVGIEYQHEVTEADSAEISAARAKVQQVLNEIIAQTKRDMQSERQRWEKSDWLNRYYLLRLAELRGVGIGAWEFLSGSVDSIWQLMVLLHKVNSEVYEIHYLFVSGQWSELDRKIADYRLKGERVLGAASEVKELLILVFHDEPTRALILDFPERWLAEIPPHERAELVAKIGTGFAMDFIIAVLLTAFTAGVGGAAYSGAKWGERVGKLGANVAVLVERLSSSFLDLAKALKPRKRKRIEVRRIGDVGRVIESEVLHQHPKGRSGPKKRTSSTRAATNELGSAEMGGRGGATAKYLEGIEQRPYSPVEQVLGQFTVDSCGAASCRMASGLGDVPELYFREALGTTTEGTRLISMPDGLKQLGFEGTATYTESATVKSLADASEKGFKSVVSVWEGGDASHAVVVDGISNGMAYIRDPWPLGAGSSYAIPVDGLQNAMTGRAVMIRPGS
jgi:hypothetical protein